MIEVTINGDARQVATDLSVSALLESLGLKPQLVVVEHKLGRAWRGYVVTAASAQVDVWDLDSSDESKFLSLGASGSATITLWVF